MKMQTGANVGHVWVWWYPEEEYKEDCYAATHISGFIKIKVWGAMHYDKLSKLVVFDKIEGESGKLTANDYCAQILNRELFDF